jgi:hypothetical protein
MFMAQIYDETTENRALYEALTRCNYFPNQRASFGEIPPSIDTRQYTPEVVEALAVLNVNKARWGAGYDLVEYKATRFNNVPRILALAHPLAHGYLVKCIHDNWNELRAVTENKNSMIKPTFHHEEKRLVVMNYEDPTKKVVRSHNIAFARRFRVSTDIANCFNSIYTHSIPWAILGIQEAKKQKNNRSAWFNKLDENLRKTKRNETQGIPIGSATSNIIVELVLGSIDKVLTGQGYDFYRYIDDYTCYCETESDAQQFLHDLREQLALYKLNLNLQKTKIDSLPAPIEDNWVLVLRGCLPLRLANCPEGEQKLTAIDALTFINRAIEINKETPDGSVLKYAISIVIPHIDSNAPFHLLEPLLNLSWHFPVLLPLLEQLLKRSGMNSQYCEEQLNTIISENADKNRSDGMSWPLHMLLVDGAVCNEKAAKKVIDSRDCVAITLLLEMQVYNELVVTFANSIVQLKDDYEKDRYWLLLYQLFYKGLIVDPYEDGVFNCLNLFDVNFVPGKSNSEAEKKCEEITAQIKSEAIEKIFSQVLDCKIEDDLFKDNK